MNSWNGTARNPGSLSAELLFSAIEFISNLAILVGTINLRLGAVRRLAYEAADCGLLSPDLGAAIRKVKASRRSAYA